VSLDNVVHLERLLVLNELDCLPKEKTAKFLSIFLDPYQSGANRMLILNDYPDLI